MREGDKFLTYNLRSWIYKATTSSIQFPQKIFFAMKITKLEVDYLMTEMRWRIRD